MGAAAASFTFRLIAYKGWNWYLAVALGLVIGIALAGLCELVFIQRLFTASRLVVTIATIGIAQFATFFGLLASNVIKAPAEPARAHRGQIPRSSWRSTSARFASALRSCSSSASCRSSSGRSRCS